MSASGFGFRLAPAALVVGALLAATPAPAARIELMNMDDAGEGFNDPTPVSPVAGNSGTTLGEQRLRVFEAVAWRLGKLLASPVTIRVEGRWDPLDCEFSSGTLASAGPRFVFRDFGGAPRGLTWYAAALANALAGRDLNGEAVARFTFNSEVGKAGCLTASGGWDYRIGVTGGNRFSVADTLFHELFHALGFISFVDRESGERFQGFDDAYSLHVEDHEINRTWGAMTDAQRLESITKEGLLHFVGGNALAHAVRLREGLHASGHPKLFAPDPVELGSSVSHWDTSFDANVDEFMEPFATELSADLLSSRLLQDLGWGVNRAAAAWIEDQNGNGAIELAVLQISEETGNHEILVLDSRRRDVLQRIPLPADRAALELAAVAHHAGPPASEIAVLLWDPQGNGVEVRQFDGSTGEEVRSFDFPNGFPLRMISLADYVGGPADELVLLELRPNGRGRLVVKDAGTARTHANVNLRRSERPVDFAPLDNFALGPAPELAVLLADAGAGQSLVRVFDGGNRRQVSRIDLPAGEVYQFLRPLGDFGGEVGSGEVAVASLAAGGGRPLLQVFDGGSGELLGAREFTELFIPAALESLPDFGGTAADELVLWTRREGSLRGRAYVVDGGSLATLGTSTLNSRYELLAVAQLPDIGRTSAQDLVVLSISERDRRSRAYLFDGRGRRIRTINLP